MYVVLYLLAGAYSGGGAKGERAPPPQNFKRGKEKREEKGEKREERKNCESLPYINVSIFFFEGGGFWRTSPPQSDF